MHIRLEGMWYIDTLAPSSHPKTTIRCRKATGLSPTSILKSSVDFNFQITPQLIPRVSNPSNNIYECNSLYTANNK